MSLSKLSEKVLTSHALNEKYPEEHENKIIKISVIEINTEELGACIRFSIRDNGNGIPAQVQNRIFKEFYTTKEAGKGTGLGLYICSEIVKKHGGNLAFDTRLGEYTEFYFDIPKVTDLTPDKNQNI